MSVPLLTTKLYAPAARANLVARPRLAERLDAALQAGSKLILVSAPAGFGKTTSISEWLAGFKLLGNLVGPPKPSDTSPTRTETQHEKPAIQDLQLAWLSLDESDNDLIRFWQYVIAALDTARTGLGGSVVPLLQAQPAPPIETTLTVLLNEIAQAIASVAEPLVLVLDDYHVITNLAIHQALAFALDHLPPHMHLIMTTRADPSLPLARWRARGQLTELREDDLRFSADEAAAFLNGTMGLQLSTADVAALEARTEGWIAGLQLAALSMQRTGEKVAFIKAFAGSNRFVIDYLVEEVLRYQAEPMQSFLLQTSILERLNGALCDAVLQLPVPSVQSVVFNLQSPASQPLAPSSQPWPLASNSLSLSPQLSSPSASVLRQLEQAHLFLIPLDDQRQWYRYHHLFAEMLRHHLRQTLSAQQIDELHRRASHWFAQHHLIDEAMQHALAAKDFEQAIALVEAHAISWLMQSKTSSVTQWLQALPADVQRSRPRLNLVRACYAVSHGNFMEIEPMIHEALETLQHSPEQASSSLRTELLAVQAVAYSFLRDPRGLPLTEQVLRELPPDNPLYSIVFISVGNTYYSTGRLAEAANALRNALALLEDKAALLSPLAGLRATLALTCYAQGRLAEAWSVAYETVRPDGRYGKAVHGGVPLAEGVMGLIAYQQGRLAEAEAYLRHALETSRSWRVVTAEVYASSNLAWVLHARGAWEEALALVEQAEAATRNYQPIPYILQSLTALRAFLWLKQGRVAEAAAWAEDYPQYSKSSRPHVTPYDLDRFIWVWAQMALARWDAALTMLAQLRHEAETTGHGLFLILAWAQTALVWHGKGQPVEASEALAHALTLAEPLGLIQLFVDEGEIMRFLIADFSAQVARQLSERTDQRSQALLEYCERLLKAFSPMELTRSQPASAVLQPAILQPQSLTSDPHASLIEPLSEREREVLRLVAAGMTNHEIAAKLVVATSTVKKHINNLFGKLMVTNRTQAVARARELGLL